MNVPSLAEILGRIGEPDRPLKPLVPSFLDPADWRPAGGRTTPAGVGWTRLRDEVLARDRGCVYCRYLPAPGGKQPLEVHHIHGWRDNRLANLESVCPLCHRIRHAGRSSAIHGSLLLFRRAATDQNSLVRVAWYARRTLRLPDRPLISLLGLEDAAPFRMDRPYLAGLYGYVVERYWLLERRQPAGG